MSGHHDRCCAHFRSLPNYYPLSLKSLPDCLNLTPSPHLTLTYNTRGVVIWRGSEFSTTSETDSRANFSPYIYLYNNITFRIFTSWLLDPFNTWRVKAITSPLQEVTLSDNKPLTDWPKRGCVSEEAITVYYGTRRGTISNMNANDTDEKMGKMFR